jgi:hypothetical protein
LRLSPSGCAFKRYQEFAERWRAGKKMWMPSRSCVGKDGERLECVLDMLAAFAETGFWILFRPGQRVLRARDDVVNLSHNYVGLAAPNLAELEVVKANRSKPKGEPP